MYTIDQHNQTLMAMIAASSIKSCRPWTMSSRLSPPRSTLGLPLVICFVIWIFLVWCLCPIQHLVWHHPMLCAGTQGALGRARGQMGSQAGQMLTSVPAKSQLPSGAPALSRDFSQQSLVMFIFGKWSNMDLEQIGRYLKSHNMSSLFRENMK